MQDQQYTVGHKEMPDKPFLQIYSALEIFKSSKIALHRTLNRFFLFQVIFKKVFVGSNKLHITAPLFHLHWSFSPQNFNGCSLILLLLLPTTNFPSIFSRAHIVPFPKQCKLCPRPQRHFSMHKRLRTITARDTQKLMVYPEHLKNGLGNSFPKTASKPAR